MEKKNIDWGSLGFAYMPTDKRYVSNYKDGKWDDGALIDDPVVHINESAGVLQYAQTCFRGVKGLYYRSMAILLAFRPDMNAERLASIRSQHLQIPPFPKDRFHGSC